MFLYLDLDPTLYLDFDTILYRPLDSTLFLETPISLFDFELLLLSFEFIIPFLTVCLLLLSNSSSPK